MANNKNKIKLLQLILLGLLFTSCTNTSSKKLSVNETTANTATKLVNHTIPINKLLSSNEEGNTYELDSDILKTIDYCNYESTGNKLSYIITLPKTWILDYTMMDSADDRKIGELLPGFILSQSDDIVIIENQNVDSEENFGQKSKYTINEKIIFKFTYYGNARGGDDGPVGYTRNQYFIKIDNYYFGLSIWNTKFNQTEEDITDKILDSIRIKT